MRSSRNCSGSGSSGGGSGGGNPTRNIRVKVVGGHEEDQGGAGQLGARGVEELDLHKMQVIPRTIDCGLDSQHASPGEACKCRNGNEGDISMLFTESAF